MVLGIALFTPLAYAGKHLGWSDDAVNGPGLAIMFGSILLHAHYLGKVPDKDRTKH